MAKNWIRDVGAAGIVRDRAPWTLPPNVWSDGRNVRFEAGKAKRMGGVQALSYDTSLVTDPIINVGLVAGTDETYALLSTMEEMFAYDGFTTTNITRGSGNYSQLTEDLFQHMVFAGLVYFNHFADRPQVWDGDTATNADNLANWDSTWKTRYLRPFNSFLFALGMREGSTTYNHKFRWSHPAEPGAVPASWDETDPAYLAGEFSLSDTDNGRIMNGLQLENNFFIYKQQAVWALSQTNNNDVFARRQVLNGIGLESDKSLTHVPFGPDRRKYHFMQSVDGFYLFDGITPQVVFQDVFEDELKLLRDEDSFRRYSFSLYNFAHSEIWFCFPETGNVYPNLAFVLSLKDQSYSIRELGNASNIAAGLGIGDLNAAKSLIIAHDDGTFFDDGTGYLIETDLPAGISLIEARPTTGVPFALEIGDLDYDLSHFEAYLERRSSPAVKYDSRNPEATIVDYDRRKLVNQVVPKKYKAGSITMQVGAQESEKGAITWKQTITLDDTEFRYHMPTPVSGRLISFRFSSISGEDFELEGFDYEVDLLGSY